MDNCHRPLLALLFVLSLCMAPENAHARFDAARVQALITEMGSKAAANPECLACPSLFCKGVAMNP